MMIAQEQNPVAELFRWVSTNTGIDWQLGIALALAGVIGALATLYFLMGQPLPLIGNATTIKRLAAKQDLLDQHLAGFRSDRARLARNADTNAPAIAAIESLTTDTRIERDQVANDLRTERRRATLLGIPLYLMFAGLFAAALATDVLQALAIGFGWTAIIDRVGLKREHDDQETARQELAGIVEQAEQLTNENRTLRTARAELSGMLEWQQAITQALADQLNENPETPPATSGEPT